MRARYIVTYTKHPATQDVTSKTLIAIYPDNPGEYTVYSDDFDRYTLFDTVFERSGDVEVTLQNIVDSFNNWYTNETTEITEVARDVATTGLMENALVHDVFGHNP